MADAVGGAVNAAATNTVPVPQAPSQGKPAQAKPAAPQKAPAKASPPDFKSKVEETLWRVNEPTADEVEDTKSMSDIIDKGVADAGKTSKEATPAPPETQEEPPPTDTTKKKYKVDGKIYELTAEQAERFAQKGIMHELRNRDSANKQRELSAKEQEIVRREQETASIIEALRSDDLSVLVQLHGEEKARDLVEKFLRPRIEREMLPPEQQEQLSLQERAERAERALEERDQRDQERQIDEQSRGLEQHYQKIIVDALEQGDFPKGADLTPFAREMASWMERGLSNNIEYTPQQLVGLVKEDNTTRVRALTDAYVGQIDVARKAGDMVAVGKLGEQLVSVLGEPVMFAIGKYYLAKLDNRGLPQTGTTPPSTPKINGPAQKQPKMTEDEYRDMRQKIARGEIEPPPWW
jgi:hypothetical protein